MTPRVVRLRMHVDLFRLVEVLAICTIAAVLVYALANNTPL